MARGNSDDDLAILRIAEAMAALTERRRVLESVSARHKTFTPGQKITAEHMEYLRKLNEYNRSADRLAHRAARHFVAIEKFTGDICEKIDELCRIALNADIRASAKVRDLTAISVELKAYRDRVLVRVEAGEIV